MNYFDVVGRTTGMIVGFLKKVGFGNIKSLDLFSYSEKLLYHLKDGRTAMIALLDPGSNYISWSVYDFEIRAIERTDEDAWKEYYDESKFQEALDMMIEKHDASVGINWDTIDYYLEEYCQVKHNDNLLNCEIHTETDR